MTRQKKLLALGCSWTEHQMTSHYHGADGNILDTNFPRWPEIVANNLGYAHVNMGVSGYGNIGITNVAEDYMYDHNDQIDLICVLWSEEIRTHVFDNTISNINRHAREFDPSNFPLLNEKDLLKQKREHEAFHYIMKSELEKIIKGKYNIFANIIQRNIIRLQRLGDYYNIPVIHMSGIQSFPRYLVMKPNFDLFNIKYTKKESDDKYHSFLDKFIDGKYFNEISSLNYVGWPSFQELGGFSIVDLLRKMENPIDYYISEMDHHPNHLGHEFIANKFIDKLSSIGIEND